MQKLVHVRELIAGPWAVMGDFNLLVNPEDKNSTVVNRHLMACFRSKVNLVELKEVYLNGRRYTWSNEQKSATLEKIDHVFSTMDWEEQSPSCFLSALCYPRSDHFPLMLNLNTDSRTGKRFRFEAFWAKAKGFRDVVAVAWASVPSAGNAFVLLDNKLWATAKALKSWSDKWIGNVKIQIAIALELILRSDEAMELRPLEEN